MKALTEYYALALSPPRVTHGWRSLAVPMPATPEGPLGRPRFSLQRGQTAPASTAYFQPNTCLGFPCGKCEAVPEMDYRSPSHALRPRVTQRPKISPAYMKLPDYYFIRPYIIGINKETNMPEATCGNLNEFFPLPTTRYLTVHDQNT
jgi:hypothetical protein